MSIQETCIEERIAGLAMKVAERTAKLERENEVLIKENKDLKAAHTASMERAAELERKNTELRDELKEQVKKLSKENTELRGKLCAAAIVAAEAEPQEDSVGRRLRTFGFSAQVIVSSTTEKALTGCAFYNPGRPFEGDLYFQPVVKDPLAHDWCAANACLRVLYSATTPKVSIEVGLFNRLYFGLKLGDFVEFKPVSKPADATRCKLIVTPYPTAPPLQLPGFQEAVEGLVLANSCNYAVKVGEHTYKFEVLSVSPGGCAVATKDMVLQIGEENASMC